MPSSFEITNMKPSWIVLRSSSCFVLGYGIGASVVVFVVGRIFFNSCFKWPFLISEEIGRCLEMRSSVSPGQVARWPFLIDWMNVEDVALTHAAWRNWANYFLDLFICTMALPACACGQVGGSEMSHSPSDMLRLPVRMMFLFLSNTWRFFLLKWLESW